MLISILKISLYKLIGHGVPGVAVKPLLLLQQTALMLTALLYFLLCLSFISDYLFFFLSVLPSVFRSRKTWPKLK